MDTNTNTFTELHWIAEQKSDATAEAEGEAMEADVLCWNQKQKGKQKQ